MRPFVAALILLSLSAPLVAQTDSAVAKRYQAHEVQKMLRQSYSLHQHNLNGKLRTGSASVPFQLRLEKDLVRFRFDQPVETITLDLARGGGHLTEAIKGRNGEVPSERYGQKIRGTEINYEDLAMRFLNWPNPEIMGEEKVKTRACWKLRVYNPGKLGPYLAVEVWVDQESGGMLKMRAFDFAGKMVKEFSVVSGQKVEGVWILRQMRVESFKPGESRPFARTYLDIERP